MYREVRSIFAQSALGLLVVGSLIGRVPAASPVVEEATDSSAASDDAALDSSPAARVARKELTPTAPVEVIQERYTNRTVKIERQVTQDTDSNYINHGSWMMWDEKGRMIGAGEFRDGERNGTWTRWYAANEGEMFNAPIYKQFAGPFISEANFAEGKLHGVWTIYDSRKRKVTEWEFDHGERNGKSTTYGPNGNKLAEVTYRNGQLDGEALEWDAAGKQIAKDSYNNGRKLGPRVEFYSPGVKKSEGMFLSARQVSNMTYDWWNASIKTVSSAKEGKDQRHGMWTSWYQNGQKQLEGKYVEDVPTGKFTWWHENGQKAIDGEYVNGKQSGRWVWWHSNGQKSIQGEYVNGNPINKWSWWREDGRVTKVADMSADRAKGDADAPHVPEVVELQKDTAGPTLQAIPQTQPPARVTR